MPRAFLVALLFALLMPAAGCQSARSWQDCPGVYSGVRYYGDQVSALPFDGKVFFSIDLLPTALVDTLALPFTGFVDRGRPPPGGYPVGCRWAVPGRPASHKSGS